MKRTDSLFVGLALAAMSHVGPTDALAQSGSGIGPPSKQDKDSTTPKPGSSVGHGSGPLPGEDWEKPPATGRTTGPSGPGA